MATQTLERPTAKTKPAKPAAKKGKKRTKRGRPSGPWVIECNADALTNLRGYADMTQAKLAKAAGVSAGTIGNLESGARVRCSVEVAQRIADALDKPVSKVFDIRKLD